jgi:hypothetical protein
MGQDRQNQRQPDRALTEAPPVTQAGQLTPDSKREAEAGNKQFLDEPWFAKLPPEMRSAIRNNSSRRPPRGYEERLQRYFENKD